MKKKWLLLLLIPVALLCLVFPPLFILLCVLICGVLGAAEFWALVSFGLIKKCEVCGKYRYSSDSDRRNGYNAWCAFLSLEDRKKSSGYVCKSCLNEIVSKVECDCCHQHNIKSNHPGGYLHETAKTMQFLRQLHEICPSLVFSSYKILCSDCRQNLQTEVLTRAIQDFLTSIRTDKIEPVLIHNARQLAPMHCARCGKHVSDEENKIKQLQFLYEYYPYSDSKSECCSVIADYLKSSTICSSCCWQLRPEHVREDFLFRSGDGWIGGVKGDSIPGYRVLHSFDTVSYSEEDCCGIDALKRKLREKSLLVGANGFINFWYNRLSKCCYTGRAVPVTFERVDTSNMQHGPSHGADLLQSESSTPMAEVVKAMLPEKLIIDGSNLLRARGTSSVSGLFSCLFALKKRGCYAQVFFDANILHVLDDDGDISGRVRLDKLMRDFPDRVQMVPAGSRADDFILLRANGDGSHILSNDRFEQYVDRYPWLKEQRLHKFMFMDGRLLIPDFGIDVEIRGEK